ncbi:MAG TPA: hypothetical protein VK839_01465 [Erythrobacter sp.]|nr:hypothetical protein [Erythrobacter sp.]
MRSLQRYNPGPGLADFWDYLRRPQPYRLPILIASTLPALAILVWAGSEARTRAPERPKVTYISTLAADRSDEEIMAENLANQEKQDKLRAERAVIEARKRELYRTLGSATGIDVETMEREAVAERAREEAAKAARREEILANRVQPGAADAAERDED